MIPLGGRAIVSGAMERWFWLTEPLAMDFANTIRRRGMADHDYLRTGADVASWAAAEAPRVPRVSARAAGRLNARARAVPLVGQLGGRAGELRTVPATRASPVDQLLARVAAAAIELVGA